MGGQFRGVLHPAALVAVHDEHRRSVDRRGDVEQRVGRRPRRAPPQSVAGWGHPQLRPLPGCVGEADEHAVAARRGVVAEGDSEAVRHRAVDQLAVLSAGEKAHGLLLRLSRHHSFRSTSLSW